MSGISSFASFLLNNASRCATPVGGSGPSRPNSVKNCGKNSKACLLRSGAPTGVNFVVSILKSRLSDAQRTSRSPDLNLNINREEIGKKVAEGQRRLQAAALALAGRQEGLRTQDDARREAERQFELAWKLNGDRLTGRLGDLEGVLGMKTGTLDAERRRLEAVRQALEKELKRIDERIVRLKERQAGGAVEPDTKGALPGEPGTLQSDTQERNADGNSPVGR